MTTCAGTAGATEIVQNERIVQTESYEGEPAIEAVDTVTFTERERHTVLTLLVQHTSRERRDAHLLGMEEGLDAALNNAEQVAASLCR